MAPSWFSTKDSAPSSFPVVTVWVLIPAPPAVLDLKVSGRFVIQCSVLPKRKPRSSCGCVPHNVRPRPPRSLWSSTGESGDTASRLLPGGAWLQILGLTVWPVLALEREGPCHCISDIRRKKTNPALSLPCEDTVKSKPPFH